MTADRNTDPVVLSRPEKRTTPANPSAMHAAWPALFALVGTIAVLYFAREVFMPLAIAVLLTFALAPVVSLIRRTGIPRMPAIIAAVTAAFIGISALSFVVVTQVSELAQQLPTYQANILTKIRAVKDSSSGTGILAQISEAVERVGKEINRSDDTGRTTEDPRRAVPLLVEIYAPEKPIHFLTSMIVPLIGPLATAGLVIVVVIFMLLEREDLRDRFIRLVGYSDLHRTTEALQDAGRRVGQYLLMQLVVNITYGIPIAIGLWWIGIPNAALWGALAIVLRFVPYIGPLVSMVLPLFLAVAVSPDWSLLLWVAALFIAMELISNNVIEPWLYGSRTGLSPLAIIIAAIFWTWLWGPVGLVLSTPLTVCLVVLGKHVPQFQFFEVLFGDAPVLDPEARLYQRLLANDPDEATDQLEELLDERPLIDVYGQVAISALLLAERDRARGVMSSEQRETVATAAFSMITNLSELLEQENPTKNAEATADAQGDGFPATATPGGKPRKVLCIGGRSALDDASAAMLAQALTLHGASAASASFADAGTVNLHHLHLEEVETVMMCLLSSSALRHGRLLVRRLKRARAALRVGLVLWRDVQDAAGADEHIAGLEADFVVYDFVGAIAEVASNEIALEKEPVIAS